MPCKPRSDLGRPMSRESPRMSTRSRRIASWIPAWIYRQVPDVASSSAVDAAIDDLPEIVLDANWKLPAAKLPHWLVHDAGPELEQIASDLVATVATGMGDSTGVARAGEMRNEVGRHRALRFIHHIQRGHVSSTDVVMRSEGKDLYIRVMTKPKTLLTYLRWSWLTAMFSLAFSSLLLVYFVTTNAKTNWAYEYAQKNASARYPDGNKEDFVRRSVLEGCWQIDWSLVRNKLRNSPSAMNEVTSKLIARAWELIETGKWLKANDDQHITENIKEAQVGRSLFLVIGIASLAEFGPEIYLVEYLQEQENNDEYALWFTAGELPTPDAPPPSAVVAFAEDVSHLRPEELPFSIRSFLDPRTVRSVLARAVPGSLGWTEHLPQVDLFTRASLGCPSVERIIRSCARWQRPWSYMGLFMADPRGGLMNVLAPCGIIGSIVGFFVWRSPKSWLRYPCRALGWLTPDDFNSEAIARNGRVVRVLSLTLQQHGFGREALTELGGEEVPA